MVKTPCFHCREPMFIPGQRTKIPLITWSSHTHKKKKKEGKTEKMKSVLSGFFFFLAFKLLNSNSEYQGSLL